MNMEGEFVPGRLLRHKEQICAIVPDEQRVRYYMSTWKRYFPNDADLQAIADRYPDTVTRSDLLTLFQEGLDNKKHRQSFLATMLWGFGTMGRGPWRTREMLADGSFEKTIVDTVSLVGKGDLRSAYETLHLLHQCGPSFVTKFLYVAGWGLKRIPLPLVLDSQVAARLKIFAEDGELVLKDYVRTDRNGFVLRYVDGYIRYIEMVHGWADVLGCRADAIEMFLFNPPSTFRQQSEV